MRNLTVKSQQTSEQTLLNDESINLYSIDPLILTLFSLAHVPESKIKLALHLRDFEYLLSSPANRHSLMS